MWSLPRKISLVKAKCAMNPQFLFAIEQKRGKTAHLRPDKYQTSWVLDEAHASSSCRLWFPVPFHCVLDPITQICAASSQLPLELPQEMLFCDWLLYFCPFLVRLVHPSSFLWRATRSRWVRRCSAAPHIITLLISTQPRVRARCRSAAGGVLRTKAAECCPWRVHRPIADRPCLSACLCYFNAKNGPRDSGRWRQCRGGRLNAVLGHHHGLRYGHQRCHWSSGRTFACALWYKRG